VFIGNFLAGDSLDLRKLASQPLDLLAALQGVLLAVTFLVGAHRLSARGRDRRPCQPLVVAIANQFGFPASMGFAISTEACPA